MLMFDAKRGRHGVFADFLYTDVQSDEELLPPPISLMLRSVTRQQSFSGLSVRNLQSEPDSH